MRPFDFVWVIAAAALLGFAPGAAAGTASVQGSAKLVQPAIITADQALELLVSSRPPGVLTISFPDIGGQGPGTRAGQGNNLALTTSGTQRTGSTFVFSVGSENAAALNVLMAQLGAESQSSPLDGLSSALPANALVANGYIDGKGFQMAVVQIVRTADGGGHVRVIIPFN